MRIKKKIAEELVKEQLQELSVTLERCVKMKLPQLCTGTILALAT